MLFLELILISSSFYVMYCEKKDCQYEFNIWHPDDDELQRMRTLEIQYANFSNYVDKELLYVQLQRSTDLASYRNWTILYEKSLTDIKTEQLEKYVELHELRVKVGIYEMKLEEMKINFESSKYRMSNHRLGRKKHIRKDRMLSTSQSDVPRNALVDSLKDMVSDLKAEWILLKREFIEMRGDNEHLHKVQNELYNSSGGVQTESGRLKEMYKHLTKTDSDLLDDVAHIKSNVYQLNQDLSFIKSAQESLKRDLLATENGLSALQAVAVEMRRTLMDTQVRHLSVPINEHSARQTADHKLPEHVELGKERHMQPQLDTIPRDCGEIASQGHTMSGLYQVQPDSTMILDSVYCQVIDGIGYTLIQRRADGLQGFNRGWIEYKVGFGNMYGDFWVGNDFLHALTKYNDYGLHIDIWDWEGNRTYAKYNVFTIGDEDSRYSLHVSGYSGNAGDSLSYHDGMKFSTEDHDNDLSDRNCAADNKGGWWYSGCYFSNLNGAYHLGWYSPTSSSFADGVVWYTLRDSDRYSVRKVEMKIRRHS